MTPNRKGFNPAEKPHLKAEEGLETEYRGCKIKCVKAGAYPKFYMLAVFTEVFVSKKDCGKWSYSLQIENTLTNCADLFDSAEEAIDAALKCSPELALSVYGK